MGGKNPNPALEIRDSMETSLAAAKLTKGKLTETRMTRNGELVVEVDNDEDAAALSSLRSLGGVSVTPRESKPVVISKKMVNGVHRLISEAVIVDSLRRVALVEATRLKTHD